MVYKLICYGGTLAEIVSFKDDMMKTCGYNRGSIHIGYYFYSATEQSRTNKMVYIKRFMEDKIRRRFETN